MRLFWKGIATVLFYVVSGALLIYAASRSLDFITQTLPPEQQLIGYLALAATSGGMIAWLLVFLYKAEGLGQKITAGLMVGVDLLGEFTLFTMDTLYQSGKQGMTASLAPEEIRAVILGMSGLIALNIIATVAFHLVDGENMRNMRESFVRDRLENEALKLIEKRGDELARSMAPAIAETWARDFENRFSDMRSLGLGTLEEKKTPPAATAGRRTIIQAPWRRPDEQNKEAEKETPEVEPVPLSFPALTGFSGNGHGKK